MSDRVSACLRLEYAFQPFHHLGRLLLLGIEALIHMGLRPSATYDIDIEVEADNIAETEEMYTIINNLTE